LLGFETVARRRRRRHLPGSARLDDTFRSIDVDVAGNQDPIRHAGFRDFWPSGRRPVPEGTARDQQRGHQHTHPAERPPHASRHGQRQGDARHTESSLRVCARVTNLGPFAYVAVATYGLIIFLGSTTESNSSAVTKPSFSAAAFNVRSLSIA